MIYTLQGYPGPTCSNGSCLQNRRDYTGFRLHINIIHNLKYGGGKYDGARNDIFLFRLWNRDAPYKLSQVRVLQDGGTASNFMPVPVNMSNSAI